MAEDSLPDYIKKVIESGIPVKEQKLIRDVLFEIYHLPLEKENPNDKASKRTRKHIL